MAYRLSKRADEDISAVLRDGFAKFGIDKTRAYFTDLKHTLDRIAKDPKIWREREELDPPARVCRFKSHLILYAVKADGTVWISRIRHSREDWVSDPTE